MEKKWLLYGAYGYTGELIAEEAIARGHRPVLAGRSQKKLAPLAAKLGLDMRVFDLRNEMEVAEHIAEFDLVFHAAGPFIHTSLPMVRACLRTQTHYVDITGEVPVFEQNFGFDAEALVREKGPLVILQPVAGRHNASHKAAIDAVRLELRSLSD